MKIAMLMEQAAVDKVFNAKTIARLHDLGEVSEYLVREAGRDNALEIMKDADVVITSWGSPAITAQLLEVAPGLKLVAHAAGSVKPVVTPEMFSRGVRIVSAAHVLSSGVSETALGFTIAAAKNLFGLNFQTHRGGWEHTGITEMYDITVGVAGLGIAGRHYAELLQAFDVEVIGYDPGVSAEQMEKLGVRKVSLEEVFAQSDILSIHAPELPSTYHMVNAQSLASMKDGAILINTARGSLVDEEALVEALTNGKLKCACLDVTDPEPPLADSPLRKLENCILTPHLAGQASNGLCRVGAHSCKQIENYLAGAPLSGEVLQEALAKMA